MHNCRECIWSDQCHGDSVCQHFSPIDGATDEIIEGLRHEYVEAWTAYMSEFEGGL